MARLGQIVRIGFGIGLILIAGAIYLPGILGTQSAEAVINARTISILSPIEGVAVGTPPAAGQLLHSGDFVAEIRNATVDQTFLTQLRSEAQTAREHIRSTVPLQEQLAAQRERLQRERGRAGAAMVERLEILVKEGDAEARAAGAAAAEADHEVLHKRLLLRSGAISQPALDKVVSAADKAHAEADRARFAAERLRHDLAAGRDGIGSADQPDMSYALHRLDEISTREAELTAQLREQTSRLAEIERVLPIEEARVRERSVARLVSPVTAIVWRPMTFSGGWVGPDRPATTLIDCSDRVIQAKLPGRQFEMVPPGTKANLRILGNAQQYEAMVLDRRGMGASELSDRFAAPVPVITKDEFLVTLALADPDGLADGSAFCNVGRRVEVVFESPLGAVDRLVGSAARLIGFTATAHAARNDERAEAGGPSRIER
jgi:multidrug resistance efflux pump